MVVTEVMDELGAALEEIPNLRVFPFPADSVSPPAAVVGYPEEITFDVTMGRGVDQLTFPVFVLCGRLSDRSAREALGPFLDGSGAQSVKEALKNGTYVEASSVRAASATVQVISMNAVDYLAAVFSVDVFGPGG